MNMRDAIATALGIAAVFIGFNLFQSTFGDGRS